MADINLELMTQQEIGSYGEAVEVIRDLEKDILILGKRLRKIIRELGQSMMGKLRSQIKSIGRMLTDAFRIDTMEDYSQAAAIYGQELAGTLYQLQLSFGGLKIAVIQAAAPIVQVLLPVVRAAVQVLTGLAQTIGYVLRVLLLGTAEMDGYSGSVEGTTSSVKSLKRTLAGFDEINRLADKSSGSAGSIAAPQLKPVSGAWKELADKILKLLEPLRKIDLTPAAASLERLYQALKPITKALFEGLEWAWYNIFVPLAQWTVEELLPVFLDTLTVALETLGLVIEELKPHFTWLWENCLKPWAEWKAGQIIGDLQGIQNELTGMTGWINEAKTPVEHFIDNAKLLIDTLGKMAQRSMGLSTATQTVSSALWSLLGSIAVSNSPLQNVSLTADVLTQSVLGLGEAFAKLTNSAEGGWSSVKDTLLNGWSQLKTKLMDPAYSGIKQSINSAIALLNGLLAGATGGVNFLARALNNLSFTIPKWVPVLGGKSFSFYAKQLDPPKIPFLAKGAVLPANKPFMAVVGDQRHGTNVEAPLSVIQEAMAAVMADYSAGNMAGHQATVAVLQELLAAVLGISIGDDAVAAAAERYRQKLAVVRGGYL